MAHWVAPEFTRPVGTAAAAVGEPYGWTRLFVICGIVGVVVLAILVVRWLVWRRRASG